VTIFSHIFVVFVSLEENKITFVLVSAYYPCPWQTYSFKSTFNWAHPYSFGSKDIESSCKKKKKLQTTGVQHHALFLRYFDVSRRFTDPTFLLWIRSVPFLIGDATVSGAFGIFLPNVLIDQSQLPVKTQDISIQKYTWANSSVDIVKFVSFYLKGILREYFLK